MTGRISVSDTPLSIQGRGRANVHINRLGPPQFPGSGSLVTQFDLPQRAIRSGGENVINRPFRAEAIVPDGTYLVEGDLFTEAFVESSLFRDAVADSDFGRGNRGLIFSVTASPMSSVPEPITLLLFGTTAAGLGLARWRQQRRKQQQP